MIKNFKLKIKNSHKGFSLIELMVAMAIIGILAAAAIVNFGKNEDREVRQEKDRLTSFLRDVQNKALTGDKEGISLASGQKLCGYGVHAGADSKTFKTYYVYTSGATGLDDSCASLALTNPAGTDYGSVFYLNNNVTQIGFAGRLFFLIPNGAVYFNGSISVGFPVQIVLTKTGISNPISAFIDQSGRIY